jgi:hypothetical protein
MTNNKQQTAVEWFVKEHKKFREEPWKYVNSGGEEAILKQAKEMEKRQIVDAWSNGFDEDDRSTSNPFKYYNEIYGGNK